MDELVRFVDQYGTIVLFLAVLADQLGVPLPGMPMLLVTGALVGAGAMQPAVAIATAVAAAMLADLFWYEVGRRRGSRVLALLCRISLEPDACVRRTENVFARYGLRAFLFAKFVPGMGTVTPPLAGIFGIGLARFLLLDGLGALNWAGGYVGLGFLFADQLEEVAGRADRLGTLFGLLLGGGLAAYVAVKYVRRRRLQRQLDVPRMAPETLRARLEAGEPLTVVDLRHPLDLEAAPEAIPGAVAIPAEELAARSGELPRDRDVVLYCA